MECLDVLGAVDDDPSTVPDMVEQRDIKAAHAERLGCASLVVDVEQQPGQALNLVHRDANEVPVWKSGIPGPICLRP